MFSYQSIYFTLTLRYCIPPSTIPLQQPSTRSYPEWVSLWVFTYVQHYYFIELN